MSKRACAEDGCITILATANPGPFCWMHAPNAPKLPNVKTTQNDTRFAKGAAGSFAFTREARRRYAEGGDAY